MKWMINSMCGQLLRRVIFCTTIRFFFISWHAIESIQNSTKFHWTYGYSSVLLFLLTICIFISPVGSLQVSWMRKLDQHILTVDNFTFIGDERFSAKVEEGEFSVKWTLTISSVSERDAQTYECQISTSPKQSLSLDLYIAGKFSPDLSCHALAVWIQYTPNPYVPKALSRNNAGLIAVASDQKRHLFRTFDTRRGCSYSLSTSKKTVLCLSLASGCS